MILTREQILAAEDVKRETVAVPEWGGDVIVSTMTGEQRDMWEQSLVKDGAVDVSNAHAKLVAASVVDEHGAPLFTADDVEVLGRKSAAALDRVVKVARRLSRITDGDLEAVKGN